MKGDPMDTLETRQHFWLDQQRADALKWHAANMGKKLTPELSAAWQAGYGEGWAAAISALKLHKCLTPPANFS